MNERHFYSHDSVAPLSFAQVEQADTEARPSLRQRTMKLSHRSGLLSQKRSWKAEGGCRRRERQEV